MQDKNISEGIAETTSSLLMIVFAIAYVGSLPLAIIFGDKWDVVISLFIPTYGFWVMIGEVF